MTGRVKRLMAAGLVVLGTLAVGVGVAVGADSSSTAEGTSSSTIYKAGRDVNITGTVDGDVFCAGQNITVDATVNGDVICAGQVVTVNGTVHGNVRLAGQTVTLGAVVDKNASVAGNDIMLQSNSKVGGDLVGLGQTATLDGTVGRDAHVNANTLQINGQVGRNVWANVNKLELQKGGVVNGSVDYTSPRTLHRDGGTITGSVTYHKSVAEHRDWAMWRGAALLFRLYWGVALLLLAVVLAALFPQVFHRWNKVAWSRPWMALLIGFLTMFALPALLFALFISVVGVPLALLVMLAWAAGMLLSAPVAAYYIGSAVFQRSRRSPVLVMLVGSAILLVVTLIPVLGWMVAMLAYWFGIGVLLLNLRTAYKRPDYKTT